MLFRSVFVSHPQHEGAWIAQKLREKSLLVRHFNQPRIANFLRITLGTNLQNQLLVQALKEILT